LITKNFKVLLLILLVLIPALYIGIGNRPVYKIQEVRIAETSREMLVSGDWIVPRYNGELRLQKPPLPYWLTAASYKVFGVNEAAARVPSIIFSVLTAALLFVWVSRTTNLPAATNGALILVTTFIGLRYSRSGEADATLMFFITAACFYGYQILEGQATKGKVVLFYLAIGLGFLTKGPAGIAIPLLTLIAAALLLKRQSALKSAWSPLGVLLFAVVAFGWYGWILWQLPEIAQQFMSKQVDETFISGTHAKPFWWYMVHIFDFYAPWGLLLIPGGIWAYKSRPLPTMVQYGLVWLVVVFALLTFTVNKQVQYALLFAPPVAILLGHYLELARHGFARFNRVVLYLFCLVLLGVLAYVWHKHSAFDWQSLSLMALIVLAFALRRVFTLSMPSTPILMVAGLTALAYVYGEINLASDAEKTDAPLLMARYKSLDALYQGVPSDGAISYYAGRVIPPLKADAILKLLSQQPEVLLIAKEMPNIAGVSAQAVSAEGQLTLWKLTLLP